MFDGTVRFERVTLNSMTMHFCSSTPNTNPFYRRVMFKYFDADRQGMRRAIHLMSDCD